MPDLLAEILTRTDAEFGRTGCRAERSRFVTRPRVNDIMAADLVQRRRVSHYAVKPACYDGNVGQSGYCAISTTKEQRVSTTKDPDHV